MKPTIGIPMNVMDEQADNYNGPPIFYSPYGFATGIMKAHGSPVLFPLSAPDAAKEYVKGVDGILFTGGQDIAPQKYGEEPSLKITYFSHERDNFELSILKEAWAQNKPILGVCRGMQLLNVAFGGTLFQDLEDNEDATIQHVQQSVTSMGTHTIETKRGSWIRSVVGESELVNSYHHQALKDVADPFYVTAQTNDGVIEAIETIDEKRFAAGVQWHPELQINHEAYAQDLFDSFVETVHDFRQPATEDESIIQQR